MKALFLALSLLAGIWAPAQYYYKDIIGTRETAELIRTYRTNKVNRVLINSYDAENTRSDDFYVEQVFLPAAGRLKTTTRSGMTNASILIAEADERGNVIRTVDSSENTTSITEYRYSPEGRLQAVVSSSHDSSKTLNISEEHRWEYADNRVSRMLRIKGRGDTTVVTFKTDERGNVVEEQSVRRGVASDPVYYYYDKDNRLTDIVRFHPKAKRLLPEYMFEYSAANQVIQRITVPANSSDYLIWRYQYNDRGLKTREAIYDKQKQLTGKIEYQYSFGS